MRACPLRRPLVRLCLPILPVVLVASVSAQAARLEPPEPQHVAEIATMLPEMPQGVGPKITDRAAWETVAALPDAKGILRQAEQLLKEPIPELPDDLYLDFSRTGNRSRYQRVAGKRHARIPQLVLAECIENRGRFLPAVEAVIRAICTQKAWTLPAHDRSLGNFKGTQIDVDLWTAHVSWTLATADYWLGDRLSPEVRKLIRSELRRRTFGPYEGYVKQGKPPMWWPACTNNWNAVCSAGVLGAALAVLESRDQRAWYVAAAERSVPYFLKGFTPDGYCSEGVGYWNYGFGHYAMMGEAVCQASGGKLDWFADPKVREIALFGRRMEIIPGVYPAFADCSIRANPDLRLMAFLSRRLKLGLADVEQRGLLLAPGVDNNLFEFGLFGFANSASRSPAADKGAGEQPLRDWFADAGILICRPAGNKAGAMGVAVKGGHNAEHHNHNDVGSFLVAVDGQTPLLDPGGETYTARTFSSQRYESGVLNSWGHPVPRVAGQLQRSGGAAAAKVLNTEFTGQVDTLVLDLRAAYNVKSLKKLLRTFVYNRAGQGSLTVSDEAEFDSPQVFGTALVTFSKWSRSADGSLLVGSGPAAVRIELSAAGGELKFQAEEIEEDCHGHHPTRLGVDLAEPVTKATITVTIRPAAE